MLPLFPLRAVLFPGALLPLHIFEPRYRQLLADVTVGDHRFGVLPSDDEGAPAPPGTIGCEALVRAVQPLPEGRANIVVSGERRFRLMRMTQAATPYAQGEVEWVEDAPDVQVPSEEELARLRALGTRYAQALNLLNDQPLEVELPRRASELSFEVAALLEWEFDARQRLLESRSAMQRVIRLLQALPALVDRAEDRAERHRHAKSNGHGAVR